MKLSMALPIAYLFSLLFQHLPGGIGHLVGGWYFTDSEPTAIGLRLTAIGTVAFVIGVFAAQSYGLGKFHDQGPGKIPERDAARFSKFCLIGGFLVLFCGVPLSRIPSIGAAVSQASSIWILGVALGLIISFRKRNWKNFAFWLAALFVYPAITLVNSGFLSFGTTSVFVCFTCLMLRLKSDLRAYTATVVFSVLCFLAFLSYFQNRDNLRNVVWGGDDLGSRVEASLSIFKEIAPFDAGNEGHLKALDRRLNQNFFAGAAARRIEGGEVQFLKGKSIVEGFQAMVPRVIWPGKPVFAGSSEMIRTMSGFEVNDNTSFGVGQVMEFYINFGLISLVVGFVLFGFILGLFDVNLVLALRGGRFEDAFIWFLPAVGMLAPLASISEIAGNVVAAFVAAYGWKFVWKKWCETV